jgi:hypothetical protein
VIEVATRHLAFQICHFQQIWHTTINKSGISSGCIKSVIDPVIVSPVPLRFDECDKIAAFM